MNINVSLEDEYILRRDSLRDEAVENLLRDQGILTEAIVESEALPLIDRLMRGGIPFNFTERLKRAVWEYVNTSKLVEDEIDRLIAREDDMLRERMQG